MSNGNGHHYSKFVWSDWENDPALRVCSLSAQGCWLRVLALMHKATPIGHLLLNGKQPTMRQLAVIFGQPERIVTKAIAELGDNGVYSVTEDGTIYSRRMVKDAAFAEVGREHASKRWNSSRPNGSPNGSPTSKPTREPNGKPIAKSHSPDSDLESRERKKESLKTLTFPLPTRDRAREQQAPEDEKPARTDRTNDAPPTADPLAAALIQRAADAIKMRVPYGEVRPREEQAEALAAQPEVEEAMGMAWQPATPVRTLEQQIAAATASATPEQIERARHRLRHTGRRLCRPANGRSPMTNVVPFRRRAAATTQGWTPSSPTCAPSAWPKRRPYQREHLKPRQPVRLTAEQLAETYRRSGLRDPRQRVRPTLEVVA